MRRTIGLRIDSVWLVRPLSSRWNPEVVHVFVVGAVIAHGGKVLCCRRAPGKASAGLWEFPGGKIEAGETPEQALAREIQEELGVPILVGDLVLRAITSVDGREIDLACYWATLQHDAPSASTDHDQVSGCPEEVSTGAPRSSPSVRCARNPAPARSRSVHARAPTTSWLRRSRRTSRCTSQAPSRYCRRARASAAQCRRMPSARLRNRPGVQTRSARQYARARSPQMVRVHKNR
ncbi:(deoxy)nucleoside triphosphate pyrophosphohydrolase [Subtercola endophyticus]|uniref:(deoxy)nucleoside triphosphate pyrophosphohydrolase n=1 Tax=Subtercola endophyticus TaxID=2895559 RepID=UPI001E4C9A84|nr:NUDIX domain-containing protein [Subtercola endophyticus]UFS57607.1 NUDIX domain-containing protein [Subtercola endophyticus]